MKTIESSMKAVYVSGYGSSDKIEVKQVSIPTPTENEILVKVKATSVTRADTMMLSGKPYIARLFIGLFKPKHPIPGTGFSGIVEAIGKNVSLYNIGDSVFGETTLGFSANAEYVAIPENGVVLHKPKAMSFEEASTYGDGHMTSLNFLKEIGKIKSGQKVLINGASGSLGSAAIQIANYLGAEVTGVSSTKNINLVKSLGAHYVIDYTKTDFTKSNKKYDVIFDTVGKSSFKKSKNILTDNGQYLSPILKFGLLLQSLWTSLFSTKKATFAATGMKKNDELRVLLADLKDIFEEGALKTVIDKTYNIENVRDAHIHVASGHKVGNVVLTV